MATGSLQLLLSSLGGSLVGEWGGGLLREVVSVMEGAWTLDTQDLIWRPPAPLHGCVTCGRLLTLSVHRQVENVLRAC